MLDDDHGLPLVGQLAQDIQQPARGCRVEVRERLVDHEQARPHHQRARHRQQLLLSAGKPGRLTTREGPDSGALHHLADTPANLAAIEPQVLGTERQLPLHAGAHDLLGGILQHGPHEERDLPQAHLRCWTSLQAHASGQVSAIRVRDQAVDRPDQGALPTARWASHQEDLSRFEAHGEVAHSGLCGTSVSEREPFHLQEGAGGHGSDGLDSNQVPKREAELFRR